MSLFVAVDDENGLRIPDLPAESFSVREDDYLITQVQVESVRVGTRQVYAINTTGGMRVRDSRGRTRFDYAREALVGFWQSEQASLVGLDDLTLLTADATLAHHSGSSAELAAALAFADPDFDSDLGGYELLLRGLDYLTDPPQHPAMPSHLIYLTALPQGPSEAALANTLARAHEAGVRVHVVLLATPEALQDPAASGLRQLADLTGGQLVLFESEPGLSFLTAQVLGSRQLYRLSYSSRVTESGEHNLQVLVSADQLDAISPVQRYSIQVQAPEAAFIQPPIEIHRASSGDSPDLPPGAQTLELLITFPDGHPRPLVSSQLLVDGEAVMERSSPPFDQFEWDLSGYLTSSNHTIRAVIRDTLGLEASTLELPVEIVVTTPSRGLGAFRPALGSILAVAAVLVAGAVLMVGLVSLSRRRGEGQQSTIGRVPRLNPFKRARLQKPQSGPPEALLIPINPPGNSLPLRGHDLMLGRDASLAAIVLDDTSVEGIHARLIRQADGDYLLRDQGSIAGTWVNYGLVPESGARLEHGDLIQLGRVEFRFELAEQPPKREIRIYPAPDLQRQQANEGN